MKQTRFRATAVQSARIKLTKLSDEERASLVGFSPQELATYFKIKTLDSGLIKEIYRLLQKGWNQDDILTREQALIAFNAIGRPSKAVAGLPQEFYRRPDLTLETYGDLAFDLTGQRRRFRMSPDQAVRVRAGQLTREQAFAEFVQSKLSQEVLS